MRPAEFGADCDLIDPHHQVEVSWRHERPTTPRLEIEMNPTLTNILKTAAVVVAVLVVLKTTGLESKLNLTGKAA